MEEIWKDIGIKKYAVSNMGNIRGQDGIRLLKPYDNSGGYKLVWICDGNIKKKETIHSLVMKAFVGERPTDYVIDHINRIRYDNRLENLRYCSNYENCINSSKWRTDIEELDKIKRNKILMKDWRNKYKASLL
jgi:hypothetical protein